MAAASFNTHRVPTCDELVSAMLSGHPLGQPVSTHSVMMQLRATAAGIGYSDDAIVASIVRIATGRTMAVSFDHRENADIAAPRLSTSGASA
ncbi:hypothetical protein [Mesorhizobium sp. KR9-304]|uniref:hypothetical protein n=1 Tax=Mesorhizobium sp. KR9-304 TaxID=3156614 RepID=UPI0032B43827